MPHYEPDQTVREARARYFRENGFGVTGGYEEKWVKLAFGPLRFGFPNSEARVRAVRYHDLHHLATEYDTDWVGEAEIAAWEIASSCRDHVAAWVLNLYAMQIGLWIAPRAVWRAFVRGRHSENLYAEPFEEALLEENLGELRERLDLDGATPPARLGDRVRFVGWSLAAFALAIASGAPLWAFLFWSAGSFA